jgi:hypothetical protein
VQLVGDRLGKLHVLLDQQDGDALVAQQADHAGELAHHQRGKALARLVEQQYLGIGYQRASDRQHLLLAARKLRPLGDGTLAQRGKQLKQFWQRPGGRRPARGDADVLDHREIREDQAPLGHIGDAGARHAMGLPAGDVDVAEPHAPAARRDEAHDGSHRGGLADTVAPEHRADAPAGHREIDAVQHVARAVVGVEPLDDEHQSKPPK